MSVFYRFFLAFEFVLLVILQAANLHANQRPLFDLKPDPACLLNILKLSSPLGIPEFDHLASLQKTARIKAESQDFSQFLNILIPKTSVTLGLIDPKDILILDFEFSSEWGADHFRKKNAEPINRIQKDSRKFKELIDTAGVFTDWLVRDIEPLHLTQERFEFKLSSPWITRSVVRVYIRGQTDLRAMTDALKDIIVRPSSSIRVPDAVRFSIESLNSVVRRLEDKLQDQESEIEALKDFIEIDLLISADRDADFQIRKSTLHRALFLLRAVPSLESIKDWLEFKIREIQSQQPR